MANKRQALIFALFSVTLFGVLLAVIVADLRQPHRMPFPSEVMVAGHKYTMRYDKNIYPDYFGLTLHEEYKILIVPDESLAWEQEIVTHELMHAAQFDVLREVRKLKIDNPAPVDPKDKPKGITIQEILGMKAPEGPTKLTADEWIEATAPEWAAILRDNPELVKYLSQK